VKRFLPLVAAALAALLFFGWRYQRARAEQETRARQILQQALRQSEHVALEGEQAVERAGLGRMRARLVQSADGKARLEYVEGAAKGRTVWDNGQLIWRWDPRAKSLSIAKCRRAQRPIQSRHEALLLRNYEPRLRQSEEVAGLPAYVLDLEPRHPGTPWKRLWVHRDTFAVLGSTDFDPEGKVVRSARYEKIAFTPPAAAREETFRPPADLVARYGRAQPGDSPSGFSPRELVDIVNFPVRLPTYLPPGYEWDGGYPYPCDGDHQAARLEYTNGLDTIVILECGHNCPPGMQCISPRGHRPSVVQVTPQGKDSALQLVATGDVRRAELEKMLRSASAAEPVGHPRVAGGR
jgi:hypothetical protein